MRVGLPDGREQLLCNIIEQLWEREKDGLAKLGGLNSCAAEPSLLRVPPPEDTANSGEESATGAESPRAVP